MCFNCACGLHTRGGSFLVQSLGDTETNVLLCVVKFTAMASDKLLTITTTH